MVLLSFDLEEFDMPHEYGKALSIDEQIAISTEGALLILAILQSFNIKATFFCTANFARLNPSLISRICADGHEVASHTYFHSEFRTEHYRESREFLETITGRPVCGFRMPRMMPVDDRELQKAGYLYNSSFNPTFLPGRYNNLKVPRTYFMQDGILQIPASLSPQLRIPLFWLSFHNFPLPFYERLCERTYKKDRYLNLYFHPWEFTNLRDRQKLGIPFYVARNSGEDMALRFRKLLAWMRDKKYRFGRFQDFMEQVRVEHSEPTFLLEPDVDPHGNYSHQD